MLNSEAPTTLLSTDKYTVPPTEIIMPAKTPDSSIPIYALAPPVFLSISVVPFLCFVFYSC